MQASTWTDGARLTDPVVVSDLTKTYPGPVEAVRGLSFRVRAGEIFGLLGPNGAGKTTTVGVLTTLVRPTSGQATVGGHDVRTDPVAVRRSIGVVFQDSVLDNDFSGAQNLRLHARLWRVPDAERRIAALLAAVGLTDRADDVVWTYSGGMRRRLEIARALLADPKVMFLDEPTLGLDPIARRDLWQVVRTLRERHGVTIVLSTHYLEEAQDVCDRVAIIDQGLIVDEGRPATWSTGSVTRSPISPSTTMATPAGVLAALDGRPGSHHPSRFQRLDRQRRVAPAADRPDQRAATRRARRDHDDRPPGHAERRLPAPDGDRRRARPRRRGWGPGISAAAGFAPALPAPRRHRREDADRAGRPGADARAVGAGRRPGARRRRRRQQRPSRRLLLLRRDRADRVHPAVLGHVRRPHRPQRPQLRHPARAARRTDPPRDDPPRPASPPCSPSPPARSR